MAKRLRFILVGCFFALMFVYVGVNAYLSLARGGPRSGDARGWFEAIQNGRVVVRGLEPGGPPASTLQLGDEILALDGQPVTSAYQIGEFFQSRKPGDAYTLSIRRGAFVQDVVLRTVNLPPSWWANWLAFNVITPAIFILTGLVVFLLKPFDKQALLLALLLGRVVPNLIGSALVGLPWWLITVMIAGITASVIIFPVFIHFVLSFPERSKLLRRWPSLEWLIYLPALILGVPLFAVGNALAATASPARFAAPFPQLGSAALALAVLYVVAGMLLLISSYRRADLAARRKLRIVIVGTIAGALPWVLLNLVLLVDYLTALPPLSISQARWLNVISHVALWVIPLSWAYAIVRHQVIPIRLIVRRGVQYLLAKNALRALLALPLVGLILTIIADPHRTLTQIFLRNSIYFYLLLLVAVLALLVYRRRLTDWIDRKFFREAYNQEKILRSLVEDVKRLDSIPEMSRRVSDEVERALHPERIYLFFREEERRDLTLGYSSVEATAGLRIPEEFRLLRFMEDQGGAQDFPFPRQNNLPQGEKEWLAGLGTRLIVPMAGTDNHLAGLFLLGEKRAEVPYTARDRELLEALADQIAIMYENLRLKERVDLDRKLKHEVLARFEQQNINLLKECPECGACYDAATQVCARDKSELTLTLPIERIVDGRYRLEQLLGRGGMGTVYEATDTRLNRMVAVKILSGSLFGNRDALNRFRREAQTSARLMHPNVVTIHDYGVLSTAGAYLVMERLYGETLREHLKRERVIRPERAARWFNQMLEGVKAAHKSGIVHRDLKPDNVLLTRGENDEVVLRILDFGLAKFRLPEPGDSQNPTLPAPVTSPGQAPGTLYYMSPEQLMGEEADERSDLFSIGLMVVEALTGQRPFKGKNHHELLTSMLNAPFHLTGDMPQLRALSEVLQKCLAKNPQERFASALEMQRELIPAIEHCPESAFQESAGAETDTILFKK